MITKYYTVITKYNLYMDSFPPVVLLDRFSRVNRQMAARQLGNGTVDRVRNSMILLGFSIGSPSFSHVFSGFVWIPFWTSFDLFGIVCFF